VPPGVGTAWDRSALAAAPPASISARAGAVRPRASVAAAAALAVATAVTVDAAARLSVAEVLAGGVLEAWARGELPMEA
jgi:NAD(P)H-nitrite reductase large subunit